MHLKNRIKLLTLLFTKLKNFRIYVSFSQEVKAESHKITANIQEPTVLNNFNDFPATVILNSGFTAVLIKNEAYDHLVNGLSDATQWTGFPYSDKVFKHSRIIKN